MYIKLNINANIPINIRDIIFSSLLHCNARDKEKKLTAKIKNTTNNIKPLDIYLEKKPLSASISVILKCSFLHFTQASTRNIINKIRIGIIIIIEYFKT